MCHLCLPGEPALGSPQAIEIYSLGGSMEIRRLDTEQRRDVRRFTRFPFQLYRDCPQWVPPLLSDAENQLDRQQNPFYRHSAAEFFLAESEGQTLGRLAVMDSRRYNEYLGAETAFFGLFEAVDDSQVACRLFDAAIDWARARGLKKMIGPRGLYGPDASGILVAGFEHRPAMGVPYNHAYYDNLLQAAGFEKDADHLSGYLSGHIKLSDRYYAIAEKVKARRGLRIKSFSSKEEMRQWVPRVGQIYNRAFEGSHHFYPLNEKEIERLGQDLITIADPRLIKLVLKGKEVIGFVFAYPDITAGLQKARGRLWPLGWYYLLREQRRTRWVNFNGLGVLPAYQGMGASILLYTEVAKTIEKYDFEHADLAQVGEENVKSRGDLETLGAEWYKRHRNYQRIL